MCAVLLAGAGSALAATTTYPGGGSGGAKVTVYKGRKLIRKP